jgi:hypothetical protein
MFVKQGETVMLTRKKSIGPPTKRIRRTRPKPTFVEDGRQDGLCFDKKPDPAPITVDIDDDPWRPWKRGVAADSHGRGEDASAAVEGAVGDSEYGETANDLSGSHTGRLALQSSLDIDCFRSSTRKVDLDHALVIDTENDVLPRILAAGARYREPKSHYLGVLVFPEDAHAWVRVVCGQMTGSTSTGTPPKRPTPPVAPHGLKPSRQGDHFQSRTRQVDLDHALVIDAENDILPRILAAGARCCEPQSYFLLVRVFPEDADGWVRVVCDTMIPEDADY